MNTCPSCGSPEGLPHSPVCRFAGAVEEPRYSTRLDPDRYVQMQQLLVEIAVAGPSDNHVMQVQPRAQAILAGMKPLGEPKGPEVRAAERMQELMALAFAYKVVAQFREGQGAEARYAANITVEALKAWEREHPPAALDPLLL